MIISLIAAMAKNYVIGYQNQLPWHLPADLKHFKDFTIGKPIIMGRKTFSSIGKALPHRQNIVITHQRKLVIPECTVVHSLTDALATAPTAPEIMIIGGSTLYKEALPKAHRMYLTLIQQEFVGDTYFPQWDPMEWQIISKKDFTKDTANAYDYSFIILERICGKT